MVVGVKEMTPETQRAVQSLPIVRYGDTSPYKCYLLHEEDGYYTVLMENGEIIKDVAGWFSPWDRQNHGGEITGENERQPACGRPPR